MAKTYLATKAYVDEALRRNARHYTVRWNKNAAQMERLNDAAGITTNTANFGHFGSVNTNYNNPFDGIYPWSGRKLCNIDINLYRTLQPGDSLRDCVVAWEGDPDFSYDDAYGVWVYTPEFWGKSWDDGGYRYFDITDKPLGGYVHYKERIEGRWHGIAKTVNIGGTDKTCLIPSVGAVANNTALGTLHTYAKNYGATLDSIFSVDANNLLLIVEYATMNSQNAIGDGASDLSSPMQNSEDEEIGSKSGYIGENGKSITYYRGKELFGNFWFYILGAYRQTATQHVFVAHNEKEADEADTLNTSLHIDTEIVLNTAMGYIESMGHMNVSGILACHPFCIMGGGNSEGPVGDVSYCNPNLGNTIVIMGGGAASKKADGIFSTEWEFTAASTSGNIAARPCLLAP